MTRSGWLLCCAALLAAPAVQAGQWDYSRTPILFVHGYFVVSQAGDATWANFLRRASEDGWPEEYLRAPSFRDVRGCNDEHVEEIEGWVGELTRATGFDRVDVVCHSMGCLNLLSWIKSDHCGARRVRRVVTLAGAMHGTVVACLDPVSCGARHMCIGSRDGAWRENGFLAALNACDETPGDVAYTCLWSEYDEVIVPPSGSQLEGARNIELDTKWVEHGGIFLCDECWERTREALLEGTGWNEDGPGWECLPEACRPPPDLPETSEEAGVPADEGGDGSPDPGTPEAVAEGGDPTRGEVAEDPGPAEIRETPDPVEASGPGEDKGAVPDPGRDPAGPGSGTRASGCGVGPQGRLPALAVLLLCGGVGQALVRRRRLSHFSARAWREALGVLRPCRSPDFPRSGGR